MAASDRAVGSSAALVSAPPRARKPYTRRQAPGGALPADSGLSGVAGGVRAVARSTRADEATDAALGVGDGLIGQSTALYRQAKALDSTDARAAAALRQRAGRLSTRAVELMVGIGAAHDMGGAPAAVASVTHASASSTAVPRQTHGADGGHPHDAASDSSPAASMATKAAAAATSSAATDSQVAGRKRGRAATGPLDAFVRAASSPAGAPSKRRRLDAIKHVVAEFAGAAPESAGGSRGALETDGELAEPCKACGGRVVVETGAGSQACTGCGAAFVGHVARAEWREGVRYTKSCQYSPLRYFQRWLAQLQGEEEAEVPDDVMARVGAELRARRLLVPVVASGGSGGDGGGGGGEDALVATPLLQPKAVRAVLDALRLSDYYKNQWKIARFFNPGARVLRLTPEKNLAMTMLYQSFLQAYPSTKPNGRVNNPHYPFIIRKFLVVIGEERQADAVPRLISNGNEAMYDRMWETTHLKLAVGKVAALLSGEMTAAEARATCLR